MAPRATRANPAKTAPPPSPSKIVSKKLTRTDNEQQRAFILPENISPEARVLSLPDPCTGIPSRYLFCPIKGLFEFSRTTARRSAPSSWLIAQDERREASQLDASPISNGFVLEDADLLLATPLDPMFFLIPLFTNRLEAGGAMFRMEDDYIEMLSDSSATMARMLRNPAFKDLVFGRLEAISHVQDLGDEKVYKPDLRLLAKAITCKVQRMIKENIWPESLEDAFVSKQLELPVSSMTLVNEQLPTPEDSQQSSISGHDNSHSEQNQDAATTLLPTVPAGVTILMRAKVAVNYLLSCYVPAKLRTALLNQVTDEKLIDFAPLEEHLQVVQKAKAEVQTLRSMSDNISRKRALVDDDEAAAIRAEKKRKKDEEELKKKSESRAIKQLKKVDVSGMQKLSSFFTKAGGKK